LTSGHDCNFSHLVLILFRFFHVMVRELPIECIIERETPCGGIFGSWKEREDYPCFSCATGLLPIRLGAIPVLWIPPREAWVRFAGVQFFAQWGWKNSVRLTEKEKFAHNTVGKELDDVCGLLDALAGGEIGNGVADVERMASSVIPGEVGLQS